MMFSTETTLLIKFCDHSDLFEKPKNPYKSIDG